MKPKSSNEIAEEIIANLRDRRGFRHLFESIELEDEETYNEIKASIADIVAAGGEVKFLYCMRCRKCVSTGFIPVPTDTPDKGIIVRAWIQCPECIEKDIENYANN